MPLSSSSEVYHWIEFTDQKRKKKKKKERKEISRKTSHRENLTRKNNYIIENRWLA